MEEKQEKTVMKWVEVYERDANNNMRIVGYACNRCGFYGRQKYTVCPFCHRRAQD